MMLKLRPASMSNSSAWRPCWVGRPNSSHDHQPILRWHSAGCCSNVFVSFDSPGEPICIMSRSCKTHFVGFGRSSDCHCFPMDLAFEFLVCSTAPNPPLGHRHGELGFLTNCVSVSELLTGCCLWAHSCIASTSSSNGSSRSLWASWSC